MGSFRLLNVVNMRATRLLFKLLPFLGIIAFLSSCRYSDNISLTIKYDKGVTNFSDSSKTTYISTQGAYRRAVGLAAFPDGGQAKYVYKAKGLYVYDNKKDELIYLKDLSSMSWSSRLRPKLVFKDNLVYYYYKSDKLSSNDTVEQQGAIKEFAESIVININTKESSPIDTTIFNELYLKYRIPPAGGMFKKAKAHPFAEWGLVLSEIYPKSEEQYIKFLVSWKNGGNSETRRAIIEQIIANKSKDEISNILSRIDKYKNSLDGYDKASYEYWMQEHYEKLQKLLDD